MTQRLYLLSAIYGCLAGIGCCALTRRKENRMNSYCRASRRKIVFSDPPYNVRIGRNVCGLGSIQHDEFIMASGEMSVDEFSAFLTSALGHMAAFSVDGAINFICIDWRHIGELIAAGGEVYDELQKRLCVR